MMNFQSRPWLPEDALSPERIRPALDALVADWGDNWFAQARPALRPALRCEPAGDAAAVRWRCVADVGSVELGAVAQASIAGAMLGASIPQGQLAGPEKGIVESLAAAAVDDLLVRLARACGAAPRSSDSDTAIEPDSCSWWNIAIGAAKRPVKFSLCRQALVAIAKRALPPAEQRRAVAPAQALGGQQVEISASIGACPLSIEELKLLSIGDVLIFDRSSEDALDLHLNGRRSPLRASLEARDGKPALVLI